MAFPERIVCLAAETPEILYRLGALDKVVGVSAYTSRPEQALEITKVSGFKNGSTNRIMSLKPELVILTSGVQKELATKLTASGATLLHLNPHRVSELFDVISLLGNIVGKTIEAQVLNEEIQNEISQIQEQGKTLSVQPKVYFEEWMEPMICGTAWISDLIAIAGGEDVFRQKSIQGRSASDRVIMAEDVVRMQPDVVLASWCGKPFELSSFVQRKGYNNIPAVRQSRVYEVNSRILQFGPMLVDSLRELHGIFKQFNEQP